MGYLHFFDDWKLIGYQNLERRMGKPRYVPEATLEDELCEGTYDFPCVARLPDGRYVALYTAAVPSDRVPDFKNFTIPKATFQKSKSRMPIYCYAESDDGIHWRKPDLRGVVDFGGKSYAPNQVYGGADGGPAFYDIHDPDPQRRFKLLLNPDPFGGYRELVTSPDCMHWTLSQRFEGQRSTDTPTSIFYNPKTEEYCFNVRQYLGDRRVFFLTTKDWKHFSEPQLVMHPSPLDPPLCGFYAMPTFVYEDIFIGLLWRIHCDPTSYALPNGAIDVALCYSCDGNHFNRTYYRPFIERNELGEHGGGCIYASSMLIDEDHQIRFYSGASKAEHFQNQDLADAALMLHTMRLDGFIYLATPSGRGTLRTRPMRFSGDDLRINARAPWGRIRVQVLNEAGEVIPGFAFDDCAPLVGDELFWTPTWNGKTIGAVAGRKRRQLEIEIITGEIYAIRGDFEMLKSLWEKD